MISRLKINQLSIKAKLQILLLIISLSSILVVSYLAWQRSQTNLRNTIFNQLTSVRSSKTYQIESYFELLENHITTLAEDRMIVEAMQEFQQAHQSLNPNSNRENVENSDNLDNQSVEAQKKTWLASLETYYIEEYFPRLKKGVQGEPSFTVYKPKTVAGLYLQYHYIANNPNPVGEKDKLLNAGEGSQYSQIHSKYQSIFRHLIQEFGYYDLFLIDPKTLEIIYSVYKEADYATSLQDGPYRKSNLAAVVEAVQDSPDRGAVQIVDFKRYYPSYGAPASFFAAPIYEGSQLIGILAIQLPIDEINNVLTQKQNWKNEGLGESGETYLVGEDKLMRSISRFLLEDKSGYMSALREIGTPERTLKLIDAYETSILLQKVDTEGVRTALLGKSGTRIIDDYRNVPVLSSYAPVKIPGLKWVILSEIDLAEAYRPVYQIQRHLFITTIILIVIITLIAGFLTERFVSPLRVLISATRQISQGELDIEINLKSRDEFGELAQAFNEMVHSIRDNNKLLHQKDQEIESLLLNILPHAIAERVKKGEEQLVDHIQQGTVLFASIVGITELTYREGVQEMAVKLSELFDSFDLEGQNYGVERFKAIGERYIAMCGVTIPRLDHTKRMMDFALSIQETLKGFNNRYDSNLSFRIGIDTGTVMAGLIGTNKLMYYLWGETVDIASKLNTLAENNTIVVSHNVYEPLHDLYSFTRGKTITFENQTTLNLWIVGKEQSLSVLTSDNESID
ncbi:adenylate/guanylate cyclase domain-containing protein [Coleofasciculus chthonoplastes]|uniref:adenylate/guanylate cyclase domain-containing protein n=1 Tax=Coleofasciculus chthonoplastes TaxID=64178 RepID=UPI0032FAB6DE